MAKITSQFSQIFIHYYSNKSSSTSKLFISEPNKALEDKMGRLFGVLEINTPSRENSQIIAQLISSLENNYYNQFENENLEIEKAFEKSLEEANKEFIKMIREKKFYMVGNLNEQTIKEKFNFAIGLLKDNRLFLSSLNNTGVFLIHKTKQDYKIIDIKKISQEENQPQKSKEKDDGKLFVNLIQGELNPPDYLFISNNNFLNYVSLERIQKIITSLPVHKAAEYFKNSLLQHEGCNFAAIIIKNSKDEPLKSQEIASLTSITELNYTESSTESLLSPSFLTTIKKASSHLLNLFRKQQFDINKKITETEEKPEVIENIKKEEDVLETDVSEVKEVKKDFLPDLLSKLNLFCNRKSKALKKYFTSNIALMEKFQKIKIYLRFKMGCLGNYFKKIPNLSKILLIIGILLLILFIYSTSYFKHQKMETASSEEFQNLAAQIEEKINTAESNLIFGDETKAREKIKKAQDLLNSLPVNSQNQKEKQEELSNMAALVISKLRKITIIDEPILIADLSSEQTNNINIKNIIYLNNDILAFDSINNNIYKINLDSREINKIHSNLSDIGQIVKARKIDGKILIYHDKNGFIEFKNDKFSPFSVVLQNNSQIMDFASYFGRLYTIDVKNNQIYRHQATDNGYLAGLSWLKEADFNLANINSLGIDTNIWLLGKDGQIHKFNKGLKANFSVKNLEPSLEAPIAFFTNDETNHLYILEPANKRLIVLNKEGVLVTQYYSEYFDNLKTFEVIEKEKKIFLVNDNKLLFFNTTH